MKFPSLSRLHLSILALLPLTAGSAHAGLIVNGSFEQPGFATGNGFIQFFSESTAIDGWTITGGRDLALHKSPEIASITNADFNSAQEGSYYLDLSGGSGSHATIFQDFATVPGTFYDLSFFTASAFSDVLDTIGVKLLGATTLLDTTISPSAPAGGLVWEEETFAFLADSTTTRLSFVSTTGYDDNRSFVDNVSVSASAVPEPSTMLFGVALLGAAGLRRRSQRVAHH